MNIPSSSQCAFDFTGRDAGIKRAVDHAEQVSPGWQDRAITFIERYAARTIGQFFVEDIRIWAHANGLDEPPHARAWGGAIKAAQKLGLVEFVEHRRKPHEGAHKTPATVWRRPGTIKSGVAA